MSNDSLGEAVEVDLRQFDEMWAKTPVGPDDPYSDIPDGIYDAVIEEARLTETASSGRPIVIWTLRIQGPQAINRVLQKNRVITEKTIPWLKEDFEKCGLALSRLSDLANRIEEVNGKSLPIEKRTKDGRANIYFRWTQRKQTEITDDDVPF